MGKVEVDGLRLWRRLHAKATFTQNNDDANEGDLLFTSSEKECIFYTGRQRQFWHQF